MPEMTHEEVLPELERLRDKYQSEATDSKRLHNECKYSQGKRVYADCAVREQRWADVLTAAIALLREQPNGGNETTTPPDYPQGDCVKIRIQSAEPKIPVYDHPGLQNGWTPEVVLAAIRTTLAAHQGETLTPFTAGVIEVEIIEELK